MKKFNVGIAGCGWVASAPILAINASTLGQVTAVCSEVIFAADRSAELGRPVKLSELS